MNTRRMIGEVPGGSGLGGSRGLVDHRGHGVAGVAWTRIARGDVPGVRRAQTSCRALTQKLRRGALILLFSGCASTAGATVVDATWNGAGGSWNTAVNWTPNTVATGIATFGTAPITAITASGFSNVNTLQFNAGASAYSFSVTTDPGTGFNLTGSGIVNNSSHAPTLTVSAGGNLYFTSTNATTTAGNAIIINNLGGYTTFDNNSTAGTANITNNGGLVAGVPTGLTTFLNTSTAGTSTITTNSTGFVVFENTSSGGQARFITNAGGIFDISGLPSSGTTAGSIEGAGTYQLGANSLTVGQTNLSTQVGGNIVDGGIFGGTGGSLVKVGTGTLKLSGVNTYTGVTTISAGTLKAGSTTGLSASSAFTVTSTLDLNGFSSSVGSLAGAGTVTDSVATPATLTVGGNNTSTTFSGTLVNGTGTLGLTKTGTGTLTLSSANTYSGATTVSAGTLQAGSITAFSGNSAFTVNSTLDIKGSSNSVGSLAGTGTVTNSAGSTSANFTVGGNNTSTTFSGNLINGVGMRLTKIGTGTLTLSGANTYSGATTVSAGTLQAGSTTGFSSNSAFTVNSTLDLNGFSNSVGSLAGAGTVTDSVAAPVTLTAGANNISTLFSGTLTDGTRTLGLTKSGTGTMTLTGTNTYTGGTTIGAGTLQIGNGGTTGSIPGNALDNGTLAFSRSDNVTYSGIVSGTGSLTQIGPGTLSLTGATNSYSGGTTVSGGVLSVGSDANLGGVSGGITLDGGELLSTNGFFLTSRGVTLTANGGTLAAAAAGQAVYSGNIMGSGPLTFGDAVNSGTIGLSGINTYTGNSTIASGVTLVMGSTTALSATSALTITGTLNLNAFSNVIQSLAGMGTVTNNGANGAVLTIGGVSSSSVFSGTLQDGMASLGLSKVGTGTLKLSGANTYSGVTTVSAGTLQAGSVTAFSPNSAFTVNGILDLHGFSNTVGSLAGSGTVINSGGPGSSIIVTPLLPLGMAVTLTVGNDGTSTLFSGTLISGTLPLIGIEPLGSLNPTLALTKIDGGTLTLTGANTYTGGTSFNGGVVAVNSDGNLGTGALSFNGGSLEALVAGGGITSSKLVLLAVGGGTFIADTTTVSTLSGAISGVGSLTKSGAGELVLTAAETYSGGTSISLGVLSLGNGGTSGSILGDVLDNGTLVINRSDNITFGGNVSGIGILSQVGPGTLTLTGSNTYSGGTTVSGNSVLSVDSDTELGASGGGITLQGGELATSATFLSSRSISTLIPTVAGGNILAAAATTTATYSGLVSGAGGLVIGDSSNSGTVALSNFNTYTGGTTVSGATLSVADDRNLGDASGGLTLDGGELLVADGFSSARAIALTANGGTLAVTTAGGSFFSGNITGAGGLTIGDVVNLGTVGLGGTNTYLGSTVVLSGATLKAFSETALSPSSAFIVDGTLDVNGFANEVGSLAGSGTVTNGDTFDAVLTAGGDNSSTVFSGVLEDGTDPLGLTKVGTGTLELSGVSSYSDPTTVTAGTLQAGSVTAFSPNSAFTVNGILDLGGFSNTVASLAGTGTVTNGGIPVSGIGPLDNPIVGPAVLTAGGDGTSTVFSGILRDGSGTLGLQKTGGGTLTLTGTNTYTGGTTVTAGILQIGNGDISGSIVGDVVNNAALVFNRSDTVTFAGAVSGTGNVSQTGSGTLVLTGTSTYTGTTLVSSGVLQVDGVLGNTAVTVQSGTALSGHGTIGGSVTIQDFGHLAPGPGAQTLSVGSLFLNSVAILNYQLSTPGVIGCGTNTLVNVAGNLTLDGLLNVTDGGSFGSGSYRLFNYGGTLTDLTLELGILPTGFSASNVTVTTAVAGQVNLLVNAAGAPTQLWDGTTTVFDPSLNGGSGTWNNFTTNFTDGTAAPNQAWQNGVAVFAANPGTVTLGADILFQGMQFESDGYSVVGAGDFALHPTGTAIISTDPGVSADISAPIVGAGGLNKAGLGLLSLSGENSYSGGTTVSGGVLTVAADTNLGDPSGGVILAGGELETSAAFSSARSVFLVSGNGANILAAAASTTGIYTGVISGDGGLTVGDGTNPGTVALTNVNNSYTGGTTVSGATLSVASDSNLGDLSGGLTLDGGELSVADGFASARAVALTANGGTLAVSAAGGAVVSGNITGAGGLTIGDAVNTGVIGLSGTNTYLGSTTIASGATLQALSTTALSSVSAFIVQGTLDVNGFANEVGSLAGGGTVTNGDTTPAVLTAGGENSNTVFSGVLEDGTDPLGLTKVGTGTLELSGTSTYSDATTISAGTIQAGSTTAFSPNSAFTVNGVLDLVGFSNTVGSLAGTGTVTSGGLPSSAITPLGDPIVAPAVLTAGGDGTSTVFSGVLRNGVGSLELEKVGAGTLTLTGTNTYTGGTTVTAGTLQVGDGVTSGSIVGDVVNNAALVFNRSDTVTFAGAVSGTGNVSQTGSGTLVLIGTSSYTGTTLVSSGVLQVDGVLGNTAVTVQSGTELSGQGTIEGSVTIQDFGHLAPGPGTQTLSVGSLFLNPVAILNYQLSTPGVIGSGTNTLVNVAGNLTLDGLLNVTDGGGFGSGAYRLINYGGTLTDLTLELGILPTGFSGANVTVTTAVPGQVNLLVNAVGAPTQFWDGTNTVFDSTVHGGDGTWDNFTTNFTNGTATPNQTWQNGVAVFSAAPGTVTLGADILFQGMQFTIDGYVVDATGAFALHPTGTAIITTDAGVTATISAPIVGTGGLNKAGLGLLTLSGENTYSGGTTVSGGVLSVATDTNLGDPSGGITLDGGELETSANFTSARTVGIVSESAPNILAAATSTTATYAGLISGTGGLTVGDGTHQGTVALTNVNNSYTGGTTVSRATLSVVNDANLGDASGGVTLDMGKLVVSDGFLSSRSIALTANGGTLAAVAGGATDFQGDITGSGRLTIGDEVNTGVVGLAGINTYLGRTTIVSGATLKALSTRALSPNSAFTVRGTLDLAGQSNTIGSLAGAGTVTNGDSVRAVLTVGDNTVTIFNGVLKDGTHSLGLTKVGVGVLALAGVNTYSGHTTVSVGTLQAGSATAFSSDSDFTVNSRLNLHGFSNEVGSLAGTGIVTNGPGISNDISPLINPMVGPAVLTAGGDGASTVFGGVLINGSGTLGLTKAGAGTLTLTGANTYTGGTIITAGTLQIGNGGLTGGIVGDVVDNGALVFSRSDTVTFAGAVSGTGNLSQAGPGTLILTGTSSYTGTTTVVSGGALQIDGVLGNTAVTVQNGAILSGQGTIAGDVAISNGGHLAPGPGAETLGVGNLFLKSGSTLDYQLSTPGVVGSGVNSLVNVTGNLTLGGFLNVTDGGMFGSGFYRLLNYTGALTNNGLTLGTLPIGFSPANVAVTTAVAGQVNLVVNATGAPTQFWDGSNTVNDLMVHGGNGTWINFVSTNFTNVAGTVNQAWQNGIAIFTTAPGTVTLGSDILYQGMEFTIDGYTVVGSGSFALHPTGLATITTDSDVTATISAPIVGAGGLEKAGAGELILTNENSYSGGTTISGGTLSVASDTNLGDPGGGLTLHGGELLTTADFNTARAITLLPLNGSNLLAAVINTTATYGGVISGTGALTIGDFGNRGTIVMSNPNNSYSGGTNVLPGTLVAAGNGTLGTGPVDLLNGTLMILAGVTLPNEVVFLAGGVLNNAGTLNNNVVDEPEKAVTVVNSGTINGNVTIGGSTDIVQLFNGSKINGNLALSGSMSSTLILDGIGQQLLSLAVTGTVTNNGSLVKQGSGTWTIDRALAAPLGTQILAGTLIVEAALTSAQVNISPGAALQLNSGGTVGNLVDNGSMIFAGSGTVNFATVITGAGNVVQNGSGTTILSGSNTYTGGTIIELGTLLVDNAQALGTGNVTVNGGVLGADPQPINVQGNYTQNAGGTLQLNIAGRAPGQFDVLNVAGSAALNGTLRLLNLGYQPQVGDKLKLVSTGGAISGRFAHFQNPFTIAPGFNTIDLVYARNSVTLEFLETNTPTPPAPAPGPGPGPEPQPAPEPVSTTDFRSFALTPNQSAAASLLDTVQLDPGAANLVAFLDKVPFANLPHTFNEISPEELSSFYEISFSNANIQRLNLESRMDDLHNGSNGFSSNMKVNSATVNLEDRVDADGKSSKAVVEPILQPGPGNRWGVWMTGFGDFVSVDGDANAAGYNFTTGGVSLGIDYRLTDELVVGVMAEYSHTWTSLKPSGNNDVNSGRGGVYATWAHHGFYLNGAIYGGYNSYNSSRSALQGLASGNTEGAELSTFISGGYDFHFGPLTVGPVAALQYTYVNIDGFSENGSLAPMQLQTASANSLRSDVGFRLFYQWQVGKVIIEPSLKAAWEHEYLYSALPVTAGFANIPGPTATFTGPAEGHDSAVVSAGVSVVWTPTLTTYLNYDGQLGRGNYSSNAVTGGFRISF